MDIRKCMKKDVGGVKRIALMAFGINQKAHKNVLGNTLHKVFYPNWQKKKKETIDYLYKSKDCTIYVAEKNNKILGFASFRLDKNKPLTAEILTNAVNPKYQRQGVGSELYKKIIMDLKIRGIKYVRVGTNNETAKKAYEKIGFKKKIEETNYFMKL